MERKLDDDTQRITTVLVVDDDPLLRAAYERALLGQRKRPYLAENGAAACRLARVEQPDLGIVDLRLPSPASGIELIHDLKREVPSMRIAMVSGYWSVERAVEAMQAGAITALVKPITIKEILHRVETSPTTSLSEDEVPTLPRAVYEHVMRVLGDCEGNIAEAARKLKINRQAIYRLLKKAPPAA